MVLSPFVGYVYPLFSTIYASANIYQQEQNRGFILGKNYQLIVGNQQ